MVLQSTSAPDQSTVPSSSSAPSLGTGSDVVNPTRETIPDEISRASTACSLADRAMSSGLETQHLTSSANDVESL
ncbi:hypothetical protein Nepgr_010004 [Nepenthes gracilis]|uniref:Uncharacterized protein n=1 Tax=Nepenthes gracilis TaxID=150966 RepID=A0AAD3SCH0_NEPGR|nr:hypothetical protein Nepgr_010004 [Nepenthes gracilis]